MKRIIGLVILAVFCVGCDTDAPMAPHNQPQHYVPCQPIPDHAEQFGLETNHALQDSLCQDKDLP